MADHFKFTKVWKENVERFLNRNNYKPALVTCIGQLERLIKSGAPELLDDTRGYFLIETKLPETHYKALTCLCAINVETGDYAPAALYFPGAKRTESITDMAEALQNVRGELGWD